MLRQLRVTVDGHAYDVTVEDLTDTSNALYPDARSMQAPLPTGPVAAPTAPTSSAATSTAAPAAAQPSSPSSSSGESTGTPGSAAIKAPMSGVVQDLPVAVGDAVESGQVVAVVEAMKLKSPIIVTRAGTVSSIDVAVGDAVDAGATILTLA